MKKVILTVCLLIGLALPVIADTPIVVDREPEVTASSEEPQEREMASVEDYAQEQAVESTGAADPPAPRRGTSVAAYGFVVGTVGGYVTGAIIFGTLGHAIALGILGGLTGTLIGTIVDRVF